MLWIGIYISTTSFICILAMGADLFRGIQNKKFWFPCKYFSLNAASITVIAVTMKLPVDLSSTMPSYTDQATKLGSLGFLCTMMANLVPSLASMDNKTLLENVTGLFILVITVIVNVCIQINTTAIGYLHLELGYSYGSFFALAAYAYMAMILLLLIIMISSSLIVPTFKGILELKYQVANKMSLTDQRVQMSVVDKLRQHVRRYWVMAETGNPQFVMASNPLSTACGLVCVLSLVSNLYLLILFILGSSWEYMQERSPYKWSTTVILITQFIGVVVGTIAPVFRCFSVSSFKFVTKWNINHFMFFKVETYWTQKLHEWKQSPIPFLSIRRRSRSTIFNSKDIILSLCIGFQKVVVVSCKVIWLMATILIVICLSCWKSLLARWCTSPIASRTDDIDEDLGIYVLQIDNNLDLAEKTLKGVSNSMNSFIMKAAKEENIRLLELLDKSTGFKGVEIFDITITCIAFALPNIPRDTVGSLFESVGEGLSYAHLVEESFHCSSEYANLRKASMSLWYEVENKCKWLDNPIAKNAFEGKTTTEIIKWYSDKAKEFVMELNERPNGELMENPSKILIAANSMYRITQTILLRYQSNKEPITKKQLFGHLTGMIADIFSACFTNIPRVITIRCQESVIEKREASVKIAAKLLGKTTKIIERLEKFEVPSMDDDKMPYIDEWRLYLKHAIP
ncbi:hypothetical protein R6Q57_012740 [Mikania cordata]